MSRSVPLKPTRAPRASVDGHRVGFDPAGRFRPCDATAARPPATRSRRPRSRRAPPWPGAHPRGGAVRRWRLFSTSSGSMPENVANADVREGVPPLEVDRPDPVGAGLDERPVLLLGLPQRVDGVLLATSASRSDSAMVLRAVASEKNSFLPSGTSRLPRSPDAIRSAKALLSTTERVTVSAIVMENSAVATSTSHAEDDDRQAQAAGCCARSRAASPRPGRGSRRRASRAAGRWPGPT